MSSSTTLVAPRQHRLTRFAAVAALTVAAAGAAVVVTGDEQTLPEVRPFAQSTGAYDDLAANKAASMRALGRHLTAQHAAPGPRYFDVEAGLFASGDGRSCSRQAFSSPHVEGADLAVAQRLPWVGRAARGVVLLVVGVVVALRPDVWSRSARSRCRSAGRRRG